MHGLPENLLTVEDFLANESFRTWVTESHQEDRVYWDAWLARHPEKRPVYEQAVATFLAIRGQSAALSDQQVKDKTQQILRHLSTTTTDSRVIPLNSRRWMAAAAAVLLIFGWQFIGSPVFDQLTTRLERNPKPVPIENWKLVKNLTGQPMVILLPDNSSVLLATGSQLRFHKQTNQPTRDVFLEGEGFFEVTKNPVRPFVVHTRTLTTKVLGTSFQVRAFSKEARATVKVKTGKVTVTPVAAPQKAVLLTVNQELQLESGREKVVERKNFIGTGKASEIITQQFTFNYTPVTEVFDRLATSYNMPIQYDRKTLENCSFTGQLDDLPYLEKLRLVCLTVEATFEIVNNQVIIQSHGCK
jgi:transmembrane sensor